MKSEMNKIPQARTTGVVVEHLADEVLVYDLERDRAHCLNPAAARVWEMCDGSRSVSDIGAEAGGDEVAWLAVEQLSRAGLLEEKIKRPAANGVSRRDLIKKIAVAAAIGVPVVTSIVAPRATHAATCRAPGQTCTVAVQCCSGLCNNGTCL
ncbi:MAG TPA: PqqD family peptide modification chaperone [Blastocatellia bacterium]|nr:PqqD family peptide modification chaperone [Blastocatellia bacterium]